MAMKIHRMRQGLMISNPCRESYRAVARHRDATRRLYLGVGAAVTATRQVY